MSGGGADLGDKGIEVVLGAGVLGPIGDMDGGLDGGIGIGG